jgi:hypothetical protein
MVPTFSSSIITVLDPSNAMKSSLFQRMFACICVLSLTASSTSAQPPEGYGPQGPPTGQSGPPTGQSGPPSYGSEGMEGYGGTEGYGGQGYGGEGYGRPAAAASPALTLKVDAKRMVSLIPLKSLSYKLPAGAISGMPPLQRDAIVAYQNGDLALALALYHANIAVDPQTASESLGAVQYSPTLRRPVWSIRIGTSIAVRGDEGAEPSPIKAGAAANQFAGGGEFGGMQSQQFQGPPPGSEFRGGPPEGYEEMGDGSFPVATSMGMSATAKPVALPTIDRPMISQAADESMKKNLGVVAEAFAKDFESRFKSGKLGKALVDAPLKIEAPKTPMFGAVAAAVEDPTKVFPTSELIELFDGLEEPHACWQPGLVFLGEVGSDEAVVLAKTLDLDFIVQFDVILKESKTPSRPANPNYSNGQSGTVENTSRARLIHVSSGKTLVSSKPMSNVEVMNLVARKQFTDNEAYVADAMKVFWMTFDRTTQVKPMPPLDADAARRRIGQIVADTQGDPLISLSEVRLYQKNGWLTESEVETAFDILGGSKGLTMLYGPDRERRAKVREMVKLTIGSSRLTEN